MAVPVNPYPPPAPNHHRNPQAIESTGRDSSGKRIFLHIISISFLAAILFLVGWTILYRLSPKHAYSPEFEMESAFVSKLNTNGSSLTATWDISLLARNSNPNFKIYVESVQSEIQYQYIGDQVVRLGSTQLPPFALKEREDKRLHFKGKAVEECIGDAVAQQISNDMSRGSVRFGVKLPIAMRLKATLFPSLNYGYGLDVVCRELDFKFPGNNGTGVLNSQPWCSVNVTYGPAY